ncbi:MAG: 2OG-Fe(II) oxygenase family protein [Steroidobacteraceae bacterium]
MDTAGAVRFQLDPRIDPASLSPVFGRARRLHIPGILRQDGAEALYRHLATEPHWSLVLHDGGGVREATPQLRDKLGPQMEAEAATTAYRGARNGFNFLYEHRRVSDVASERSLDPSLLARFVDFLNSEAFIGFARKLTGMTDIEWADAQATRYRAGHFLTTHDDQTDSKLRRAAYVLNLTPGWKVDFGGLLQFIDDDGHVSEAYVPRFNALNIFAVPQLHGVSMVTPFAAGARYAVTGWLRAR